MKVLPTLPHRKGARIVWGLATFLCLAWALPSTPAFGANHQEVTNPISQFPVIVDGQFTDGVDASGELIGEWSDVRPLAFNSPTDPTGTLFRTTLDGPLANSLLYVAIAPGEVDRGMAEDLYLMYDYLPRTDPNFQPGEVIADISFPIMVGEFRTPIMVQVVGNLNDADTKPNSGLDNLDNSFFDVFVVGDLNGDGQQDRLPAVQLGMEAAVGFGPSTLSPLPHLLVELEVPLRIPANFGPGFPAAGINPETGLYDPNPAFWRGDFAAGDQRGTAPINESDPPGSAALFVINPDGSTTANSALAGVPLIGTSAPSVACSLRKAVLWPPNHNLVNVGLGVSATPGTIIGVRVFGDEDDADSTDGGNHSPDAKNIAPGTLWLRAERNGNADGRVYLIVVTATDAAGNVAFDCCAVVVPRNQSAAALAAVNAQAAAAELFCTPLGSAPTPFVIGDGPTIGPKQ
ncbi:MAG: hypothetical protein HY320_06350 [Armatimonadetes bacterium]|nr:hypothetical protein [Armatimonadota bacterium]